MDNDHPQNVDDADEQPQRLFGLLDRYVGSLHAGDAASRSSILERNPDLAGIFDCLDALESLAPGETDQVDNNATLLPRTMAEREAEDHPADFGKYALVREIGRGGMGVVYLAKQTDLDRVVALKMILSSRLASKDEIRRFYSEAKAAGRVRHPHIVGIHEVGEVRGQHYFAMDYVEGRSLADVLRDGPLAKESAVGCLICVARAVQCLHEHEIIHRDLKPANILIDQQGHPYVTDFGLAKVFDAQCSQTGSGTVIGTPSYMPPEQAAGHVSEISTASDVYSLGAILYELLTGRPPFMRNSPYETLLEVIEGEPTPPSKLNRGIAPELELICMRCLEKEPQARYSSAAAFADDLERYQRGEAIEARPSSWFQKIRRWGRRQPALASHLGGLAVAAVILQTMFPFFGSNAAYHGTIMSTLGMWAVVSMIFQAMLAAERTAYAVRFAWSAADVIFLTMLLFFVDPPIGPLLVGYPLLIATSALFFRVRLVLFTTFVSLLAHGALVVWRGYDVDATPVQYPVLFSAVLAVIGFVVAHQVYRIRMLTRFYEHRRLP
ncbi:MAG: protein kinase [Planctomycetaceae bacterium]